MKKFCFLILSMALMLGISCMEEEEPPREITVSWTFLSAVTDAPISGVRFSGITSNDLSFQGTSDGSGEGSFTFDGTGAIRIEIQATHPSFGESSFRLTIGAGETSGQRTFSMTPNFEVSVDPSSLNFGSTTHQLEVTISNEGTIPINFSINSMAPEVSITPSSGEIAASRSVSLSITLDRSELEPGEGSGSVSITIDELNNNLGFTYRYKILSPDELNWVDEDEDGLIDIRNIDDLYRLSLEADRDTFANTLGFELLKDLDFDRSSDYKTEALQEQLTTGEGWMPIAISSSFDYDKVFEGNEFAIHNLYINRSSDLTSFIAETTTDAVVRNLSIEIKSINGSKYTSGLIGWNRGTVENCSVKASQQIIVGAESGLLIGRHEIGTVAHCYTEGTITSTSGRIGGLIGVTSGPRNTRVIIEYCYSNANINGDFYLGGLIGSNEGSGSASVNYCYSTGNVVGFGARVGGLIGNAFAGINSCYSHVNVSTINNEVGGLVGRYRSTGSITSCYSTGTVKGSRFVGGFIGNLFSGQVLSTNYWDINSSGISVSSSQASGLSTTELQGQTTTNGIYITWNPEVWDFGTASQYPALKGMPNGLEAQRD